MGIPDQYAGKLIRCPACKEPLKVPSAPASTASAPVSASTSPDAKTPPAKSSPAAAPSAQTKKVAPPATTKSGTAPRPPSSRSTSASTPTTRTTARHRAAASSKDGVPTKCPSCGESVPFGKDTCACGYHLKLKRNLSSLRNTISQASLPDGVRADGSTYTTRREKVQEHQAETRRTLRKTLLVTLVCAGLLAVSFVVFLMNVFRLPSLETLRENDNIRPPTEFLTSFHPYHAGETVSLLVPLETIRREPLEHTPPSDSEPRKAWTHFADMVQLPFLALDRPLFGTRAQAVLRALEHQDGTFRLEALRRALPVTEVILYREGGTPSAEGYLRGVLLDFGGREGELLQSIQQEREEHRTQTARYRHRREQLEAQLREPHADRGRIEGLLEQLSPPVERRVRLTGRLGFVPMGQTDLLQAGTKYGRVVVGGGTRIPERQAFLDPEQEAAPSPSGELWYFCPVIRVASFTFESVVGEE